MRLGVFGHPVHFVNVLCFVGFNTYFFPPSRPADGVNYAYFLGEKNALNGAARHWLLPSPNSAH